MPPSQTPSRDRKPPRPNRRPSTDFAKPYRQPRRRQKQDSHTKPTAKQNDPRNTETHKHTRLSASRITERLPTVNVNRCRDNGIASISSLFQLRYNQVQHLLNIGMDLIVFHTLCNPVVLCFVESNSRFLHYPADYRFTFLLIVILVLERP